MSDSSAPIRSSMRSSAAIAVRRRNGGHTAALTSSPTPMPMPVSARRPRSIESSFEKPVVSTIRAVAATVVASSPNQGSAPIASPRASTTTTAVVSRPSTLPTPQARTTATTAAVTWRRPREKVR